MNERAELSFPQDASGPQDARGPQDIHGQQGAQGLPTAQAMLPTSPISPTSPTSPTPASVTPGPKEPIMNIQTRTSSKIRALWIGTTPQVDEATQSTMVEASRGLNIELEQVENVVAECMRGMATVNAGESRPRPVGVAFIEETPIAAAWISKWRAIRAAWPECIGVLMTRKSMPGAASLRAALRERISDVCPAHDVAGLRICAQRAIKGAKERAKQLQSLRTLKKRCKRLESSRQELLRQVGAMSQGMMLTYRQVADQMKTTAAVAEFEALIRQELDIEGLLRTMLEYTLKRVGPTNGAIFLPTSCGDFSLGAYINYDRERESAETVFGDLADTLAPACESFKTLTTTGQIGTLGFDHIDEDHWVSDHAGAFQAIWHDGECLAVIAFFRNVKTPFKQDDREALTILNDLFGKQLARIIKTHHRHKTKGNFGGWGSDSLAA